MKSNSHQIKPKQNKLTYALLQKTWELSSIDSITDQKKRVKR